MRSIQGLVITAVIFMVLCINSGYAAAQDADMPDEETGAGDILSWELPGTGAGPLVIEPLNGKIWTFFHQSGNLVALDPDDGTVLIDVPLTIRPTALAFCRFGTGLYLVGEPLDDQIIDRGILQIIDQSNGKVLKEFELDGACNAVYSKYSGTIYIASGMQYAYEGIIYKLSMNFDESGEIILEIESQASCGKIPWAIAERDGTLYVTDLELQWSAQADGTMGPPYGAWVWAYDADTLELLDKSWVGINPSRLAESDTGILVACSGSKQGEGNLMEPAFSFITGPGESEPIFIGTAGVGDFATSPTGSFAFAILSDWGPPATWSFVNTYRSMTGGNFPDTMRWVFTSDLAIIDLAGEGAVFTSRIENLTDSYFRDVAISLDGVNIYALQGEPEELIIIPVEMLLDEAPMDGP
ncbi:hypothetical protein KAU08_10310 [bacterium]|nr:hypothetical protein [bacterium]